MKTKLRLCIKAGGALLSFIGLIALLLSFIGTFLPVYLVDGFGISLYGIAFSAWDYGEMICSSHWILWLPLALYFFSIAMYVRGFWDSFRNRFSQGGIFYLLSGVGLLISLVFFSFSHWIAQTSYPYSYGYFLMVIPGVVPLFVSLLLACSLFLFPSVKEASKSSSSLSYDPSVLEDGKYQK